MMSYQKVKHERLIYVQMITDVKVHLGMLESYSEVRKQMSWIFWKSVYDKMVWYRSHLFFYHIKFEKMIR